MDRRPRPGKAQLLPGLLAAALAFSPAGVDAQSVYFSGYTHGCFNCTEPMPGWTGNVQTANFGALSFVNSTFEGTTLFGYLPVGDEALNQNGGPVQNFNNFGAFYLDPGNQNFAGTTFTLFLYFTSPVAHSEVFTAALVGGISTTPSGGVTVNFGNDPVSFGPSNQYSVMINDVGLTARATRSQLAVSGALTATSDVVPEPLTMTLLGTGLLGLGMAGRRRRRLVEADLV